MPKTVIRLTAHYVNDFEACKLYFNRTVNLQRGELSKAAVLARGTAIHYVLAEYYKGVKDSIPFDDNVTVAIEKFQVEAMSIEGLLIEDIDPVIATFHEYTGWYRDRDNFKILSVEETLSKVLYEDENVVILWEGTQDLNVESIEGVVLPYDHKSESSKTSPSGLDNQFLGYCWLTGSNRMMRNAIGFQKSKPPSKKFYRTMYSYSNDIIERWKRDTTNKALEILESYKTNYWPPSYGACDTLHRNKGCPFRKVCLESEGLWDKMLEEDFVHVDLYDRR